MKGFARFVVKHRTIILMVFILLSVLSIIATSYVKINSDIIAYIPEGTPTYDGYAILKEDFGMVGDAEIAIQGISEEQAASYAEYFGGLEGITTVIWSGSMDEMGGDSLALIMTEDELQVMQDKMDILFNPTDDEGKEYYVFMLQLDVVSASAEADALLETIDARLDADNLDYAFGGSSAVTKNILDATMGDIGKYTLIAVLVIIIILIIATSSYYEPVILLITLGISVLLNLGSNIFLNNLGGLGVSLITFSASSILQLGLSMDYAIFLMHAFKEERERTPDINLAMRRAIPKTFATVSASALTTVGGFVALFAMQFGIGLDLGAVLAKGVILSLISVLMLQPCIIIATNKMFVRFEHKPFAPTFPGIAKFSIRNRWVIAFIALVLLVPAFLGQYKVDFSYMKIEKDAPEVVGVDKIAQAMGNSFVVIVPVGDSETGNIPDHLGFIEELNEINNDGKTGDVQIFSIYTVLPERMAESIPSLISISNIRKQLSTFVTKDGYTMYSIMVDAQSESDEAFLARERITGLLEEYFPDQYIPADTGQQNYYITGMTQGVYDLSVMTPDDFRNVSLISLGIIALILILTFRSFKESLIILLVIELGIWINLSIAWLSGVEINFMAYIIISSIQLGSTVDYAILLTAKFKKYSMEMSVPRAAYYATGDAAPAILTSASIMAGACLSVWAITGNAIIAEVVMLVARGAIISCGFTLVLLPALLILFTRELIGIPRYKGIHTYIDIAEEFNRGTYDNKPFVYPTPSDLDKEEFSFRLVLKDKPKQLKKYIGKERFEQFYQKFLKRDTDNQNKDKDDDSKD